MIRLTRDRFHRLVPEARAWASPERTEWAETEYIFSLGKSDADRDEVLEWLEPFDTPFNILETSHGRFLEVPDGAVATLLWFRFG
jgi:hypothetical protein